jgi:hypothetical protein
MWFLDRPTGDPTVAFPAADVTTPLTGEYGYAGIEYAALPVEG